MATLALRDMQLTAAYEDLQRLVYFITHRFAKKYGVPFEDLISEAHVIFMEQYARFDPSRGSHLSSWIYLKVRFGLVSFMRKQYKHLRLASIDEAPEQSCDPEIFLTDLRGSLSEEANAIVSLVLDMPKDFELLLRINRANTKRAVLSSIHEHLTDQGWTEDEVEKYVSEISAVLTGQEVTHEEEKPEPGSFWDESSERVLSRIGLTRLEVRALLS